MDLRATVCFMVLLYRYYQYGDPTIAVSYSRTGCKAEAYLQVGIFTLWRHKRRQELWLAACGESDVLSDHRHVETALRQLINK